MGWKYDGQRRRDLCVTLRTGALSGALSWYTTFATLSIFPWCGLRSQRLRFSHSEPLPRAAATTDKLVSRLHLPAPRSVTLGKFEDMATSPLSQQPFTRSPLGYDLCFTLLCGTRDPVSPLSPLLLNESILSMILDLAFMEPAQAIDLLDAAGKGQLRELRAKLHLTDVDLNSEKGSYDVTALMVAARNGHSEAVQLLLQAGADPNTADSYGETALMRAARNGHTEAIQLLLQTGADPHTADDNGETALMVAASNGHSEAIQLLLQAGADPNTADMYGETTLMVATDKGHTEAIQLLLQAGADPPKNMFF